MFKFRLLSLPVLCVATLVGAPASAQSAKATMQVSGLATTTAAAADPSVLSTTYLHTSNDKDLYVDVALQVGLMTDTLVRSKGNTKDTSWSFAGVKVWVEVDGVQAMPGEVVFSERRQELMAKFGGYLDCTDTNGDNVVNYDECTLTEEELQLILDTLAAHSFNFMIADLEAGDHVVQVKFEAYTDTYSEAGSANARAWVGLGSVVVEEVRLVKGQDLTF